MKKYLSALLTLTLVSSIVSYAQCPAGQVEVSIQIKTDAYGGEIYWQLLPSGNACGSGTVFAGGNNLVGCNGGGQQNSPSGGYANNATINAGPWCLTEGSNYDILYTDDYADGGALFTVFINGFPLYSNLTGSGNAPGSRFTFTARAPFAFDMIGEKISTPVYVTSGNVNIRGEFFNTGTDTITSLILNYTIDNGSPVSSTVNSISVFPFTHISLTHPIAWSVSGTGVSEVKMWASNLNGNIDMDLSNDTAVKTIHTGPGIPNIIDDYIGITPIQTEIANIIQGVQVPRDLDFHPILTRNELWVILKSTENIGGKTVKISDAGRPTQTELVQIDGNAWHFMSLPTGIAFSDNTNFATSPGVYDANHNGGAPFTGPALWSSDPLIYAQPSGGNGSHLDMLHESPYSMGICHEVDNVFWLYDGNSGDVVRYDFKEDHGPGNSDHSDAIIRRYSGMNLDPDPTYHVPSHLVLQKETGMLYIVDTGNDRVIKMDINTGSFAATLTPYETVAEYSRYTNFTWSVFASSGLVTPSGVDVIGNRVIVSDYATGDIIIYDNSSSPGVELGRIVTGTPGIMGVKIGPDGKIWYVNASTNQVMRLDGIFTDRADIDDKTTFVIYPNPTDKYINIRMSAYSNDVVKVSILNALGKIVKQDLIQGDESLLQFDLSLLPAGMYTCRVQTATGNKSRLLIIK
ncbi:MAG: T9SS C-terminal target domain-containing protein [Bacteroidetes bacterium]|nr:MAG: T9SS C-terminal target domain-containing protein [Bacteroidota bacterium]REK00960.1 MAG: T9SS C-terminal target domain-containing protein [Bacteroidota bacterium]REK34563.1 MAG: T9SS C-terminal target domain-containing protein [Bacteroidota bacterium]REK51822.1 MAG: T9SS C-terminal target domain-containing protein [Bacteroidota bacterium]